VHQRQFAVRRGRCLRHAHLWALIHQAVAQQAVFRHGKAMAGRQRQNKVIGVKGLQGWNIAIK